MTPNDALIKARGLLDSRQFAKAEELLKRHLQRFKDDPAALDMMGELCIVQLYKERALYYFQQAMRLRPGDPHIALHVAETLTVMGRESEAADTLTPLAKASPADSMLAAKACKMLIGSGRLVEAGELLDRSLAVSPDSAGLLHAQGIYFQRIGDSDAARRTLESLKRVNPGEDNLLLTLASTLNYDARATPRDQYVAHAAFGRILARRTGSSPFTHAPAQATDGRIRVGLVSPDFRLHSVMFFAEPILDHLDKSRFHTTCYSTRSEIDLVTQRVRTKADSFIVAVRATDEQLARRIKDDRIDILIELCGLFAGHSLGAMVLKPAPVQVTYIGYPNTTGLESIDYRIVDSITDPPSDERYTTEALARMDPCFICYKPDPQFLAVPPSPTVRSGPFTFGCFNAAMKLSDALLGLWASILDRAAASRLLVKSTGMEEAPVRDHLRARMLRAGIDLTRVEIVGRTPDPLDHLRRYHDVDLALDTFPYNGTTTTCEALFMGVPVLTLTGATHASRVGATLMRNAGHPELVATSPESFIEHAARFAADRTALTPARERLRDRFLASVVCDGPAFGQRLGDLLASMWSARRSAGAAGR